MAGLHNFKLNTGKGDTLENYSADGIGRSNTTALSMLEMRKQLLKIIIKCLCSEEEKFIKAENNFGKQCFQLNAVRAQHLLGRRHGSLNNFFGYEVEILKLCAIK